MIKRHKNKVRSQNRKQCKTLNYTKTNKMYDLKVSQELFEIAPIDMEYA